MVKHGDLVGKQAPPVELPSSPSGKPYKLPIGEKPIAMFFFPDAFSVGCTKEVCAFRDAKAENMTFKRHPELEVVGISHNDEGSQKKFADENQLAYPLLSDVDSKVAEAYGVGKWLFGMSGRRVTFFIDREGIVRGSCEKNFGFGAHTTFIEEQLKAAEKREASKPTPTSSAPPAPAPSSVEA